MEKLFLSGNEAIALGAIDAGLTLGVGYPGTPSSEILDNVAKLGGAAEWAPNEKCALEVGAGVAFAQGNAIVTMKHVGVNVAADPLYTLAYIAIPGGLVLVAADDPGMASSQNEQDSRRHAVAAGVVMLEPADSQQAYEFTIEAFKISREFKMPVMLRVCTRICHSKAVVERCHKRLAPPQTGFTRDIQSMVMIPAFARKAHLRMRMALHDLEQRAAKMVKIWGNENQSKIGIIASSISVMHAIEAAPAAAVMQLTMSHPWPIEAMRDFAGKFEKCYVIEEGDPILYEICRANRINVIGKEEVFRFGELNASRVAKILAGDNTLELAVPAGKPPQLCLGCPHRKTFEALRDANCIVSGDIGCYTLGVLPPFNGIDSCVCMGASITVGLGMRHSLPEAAARRVVSIIGDSTFWHTGINGIVEMVYNRPKYGHVVVIVDNATTAMTGMQENPGTGYKLDHQTPSPRLVIEDVVRAMGVDNVDIVDTTVEYERYTALLAQRLKSNDLTVIIARRPCILAVAQKAKAK